MFAVLSHRLNLLPKLSKTCYLLLLTVSAVFIVGIIYAQQRIAYPLFLNETFASFTITAALFWLDP